VAHGIFYNYFADGTLSNPCVDRKIARMMSEGGIDWAKPIVHSCGGYTSALVCRSGLPRPVPNMDWWMDPFTPYPGQLPVAATPEDV